MSMRKDFVISYTWGPAGEEYGGSEEVVRKYFRSLAEDGPLGAGVGFMSESEEQITVFRVSDMLYIVEATGIEDEFEYFATVGEDASPVEVVFGVGRNEAWPKCYLIPRQSASEVLEYFLRTLSRSPEYWLALCLAKE